MVPKVNKLNKVRLTILLMQVHSYLHGVPLGYKTDDPCGRGGNSLGIIREDVKY